MKLFRYRKPSLQTLLGVTKVKREAKRGANAGKAFLGCSTYPKCRGVTPIGP